MHMPFITPSAALECPVLWRDFRTDNVRHATLEITGLGLYRAFLNGQRVGEDYLTPGGRLGLDTQTAYLLALKHGICRDKAKLISCFRARLKKDFYRITCGFTGAPLRLPVLLENGMTDVAYRMLLSEEFPGWLYAVNLGATTIWERWNSLEADGAISGTGMNSLNHYAYGSVCEAVADGNCITHSKPHPEVFLKAAAMLGLDPADCLVEEDAHAGVEAAVAGGFDCAAIDDAQDDERAKWSLATFGELNGIA